MSYREVFACTMCRRVRNIALNTATRVSFLSACSGADLGCSSACSIESCPFGSKKVAPKKRGPLLRVGLRSEVDAVSVSTSFGHGTVDSEIRGNFLRCSKGNSKNRSTRNQAVSCVRSKTDSHYRAGSWTNIPTFSSGFGTYLRDGRRIEKTRQNRFEVSEETKQFTRSWNIRICDEWC